MPTTDRRPDVLVIGGGAGGLGAARAAARRGATTLLVQHGPIGGDCTFTGCVPSKTVIEAASRGASFGEAMSAAGVAVATVAAAEDDAALQRAGVEVVHGWARFTGPRTVDVDGTTFRPRHVVIATGAKPALPPIPGLADADPLTSETVFDLDRAPASLAILGGGAIGCELAQAMQRLGVVVTLVEGEDRLLPHEEPDASAVVIDVLRRDGVGVRTDATVAGVETVGDGRREVRLRLDDGSDVVAERLLVAVGRRAATEGIGLQEAGVATAGGSVVTDDTLATTARGIWAVGDVAGRMQLTHAADEMGRIAVGNALSRLPRRRFRAAWVPSVTFTDPEVARVGVTEADAPAGSRVAFLPMAGVDRAIAAGETDGFVKLVAAPRRLLRGIGGGRLAGATIVAPRAGEMIAETTVALRTGMFVGRLAQTIHAYPTWSTAVRQAAAQLFTDVDGRRAHPARALHGD